MGHDAYTRDVARDIPTCYLAPACLQKAGEAASLAHSLPSGTTLALFVRPRVQPDDTLRLELLGFARRKLGSAVAPKEIELQDNLPKTSSGKIMRRLLKARE